MSLDPNAVSRGRTRVLNRPNRERPTARSKQTTACSLAPTEGRLDPSVYSLSGGAKDEDCQRRRVAKSFRANDTCNHPMQPAPFHRLQVSLARKDFATRRRWQ